MLPKEMLEDGFKCINHSGEVLYLLKRVGEFYNERGSQFASLYEFDDNLLLLNRKDKDFNIVEIYDREDKLVWVDKDYNENKIALLEAEIREKEDALCNAIDKLSHRRIIRNINYINKEEQNEN
jgi:hypothetical protein